MPVIEAQSEKLTANAVSRIIVDSAMRVHSTLGPGLLESTYHGCLKHELLKRGCTAQSELGLPVVYDGVRLDFGYRIDLLVNELVIIEVKSIDAIAPIHEAQLMSYLKLSGKSLGLLINFNVAHLKDGIRRFVMGHNWN
jgi:GxxExxY protein